MCRKTVRLKRGVNGEDEKKNKECTWDNCGHARGCVQDKWRWRWTYWKCTVSTCLMRRMEQNLRGDGWKERENISLPLAVLTGVRPYKGALLMPTHTPGWRCVGDHRNPEAYSRAKEGGRVLNFSFYSWLTFLQRTKVLSCRWGGRGGRQIGGIFNCKEAQAEGETTVWSNAEHKEHKFI